MKSYSKLALSLWLELEITLSRFLKNDENLANALTTTFLSTFSLSHLPRHPHKIPPMPDNFRLTSAIKHVGNYTSSYFPFPKNLSTDLPPSSFHSLSLTQKSLPCLTTSSSYPPLPCFPLSFSTFPSSLVFFPVKGSKTYWFQF